MPACHNRVGVCRIVPPTFQSAACSYSFVLLLLLLVLGANASRQARQWERKVVRYERAHSGTGWSKKPSAESKDSKRVNKANRLRP